MPTQDAGEALLSLADVGARVPLDAPVQRNPHQPDRNLDPGRHAVLSADRAIGGEQEHWVRGERSAVRGKREECWGGSGEGSAVGENARKIED